MWNWRFRVRKDGLQKAWKLIRVWLEPPRPPFHNGTETDSVLHLDRVAYCWPSSFLPPYCQGHAWQYWTENLGIFISPFGTILFSIQFWNVCPWHIWKTWIGKMLSSEFSQLSFPRHSGLLEMCRIRQSSPPFSHVPQVSPFHSVKSALSQRSHTCPLTPWVEITCHSGEEWRKVWTVK